MSAWALRAVQKRSLKGQFPKAARCRVDANEWPRDNEVAGGRGREGAKGDADHRRRAPVMDSLMRQSVRRSGARLAGSVAPSARASCDATP